MGIPAFISTRFAANAGRTRWRGVAKLTQTWSLWSSRGRVDAVQQQHADTWKAVEKWAESMEEGNPHAVQRLATLLDWLDGVLDAQEVQKVRVSQLEKLWGTSPFVPIRKSELPKGAKVFHFKWVDKCKEGIYKSRFTCADIRRLKKRT